MALCGSSIILVCHPAQAGTIRVSAGVKTQTTRALARVKRNEYTKTLDESGVEGFGYANCTNAVYGQLFDATAKKLKEQKALPKNGNLRNAMTKDELVYVMMAETLAKGRIEEEKPTGNGPCTKATKRSASFVRQAIDAEKKDRQKPLV